MPVKIGHLESKKPHMKLNHVEEVFNKIEDLLELNYTYPVLPSMSSLEWEPYNSPKSNGRFACSITSLDGCVNGIDMFSVFEYNIKNNTDYTEMSFSTPTKYAAPFNEFINTFETGRSHYLKIQPGGYFPWHRDADPGALRVIYTIQNCDRTSLVWILDDKVLPLENNKWYCINTAKKHVVFNPSSGNDSVMALFNIANTVENKMNLYYNCLYK